MGLRAAVVSARIPRLVGRRVSRGRGRPRPGRAWQASETHDARRLPHRLRWELVCVEAISPTKLVSRIQGDFVGHGTWTITATERGTRAVLEWEVEVRKGIVRHLTPLLRPVFAWNHHRAMCKGLERIVALSEAR
jgi:hypothetical protein